MDIDGFLIYDCWLIFDRIIILEWETFARRVGNFCKVNKTIEGDMVEYMVGPSNPPRHPYTFRGIELQTLTDDPIIGYVFPNQTPWKLSLDAYMFQQKFLKCLFIVKAFSSRSTNLSLKILSINSWVYTWTNVSFTTGLLITRKQELRFP